MSDVEPPARPGAPMEPEPATASASTGSPTTPRPNRRRLRILLALIVVLTVTNTIGDIIGAGLVVDHPLWLIALNSRKRWILAVVPHTDLVPFFIVAVARQLLSDPLYYAIGRWYGDAGARWLERKMGEGGSFIRLLESGFAKASWPMVVLVPNPIICMLAGASHMPPFVFGVLNIGGTIATIAIFRTFGDVFGGPIKAVTGFLDDYRVPIIAISFVLFGLNTLLNRKKGTSELESVSTLERELDAEAEAEAARDD
jgi:membrane protein DedA with SNARE-associated domain